jgi:hypothetical protein
MDSRRFPATPESGLSPSCESESDSELGDAALDTAQDPPTLQSSPEETADELPLGIEPWSGQDMPEGTASSHDLHGPAWSGSPGADPGNDPGSVSSFPPQSCPPSADEINYRRIYETRFRDLDVGQRESLAAHVSGPELFALCLDATPQVIAAVLDNSRFGLDHARVIALQHKTPQGLEILARRAQLLRDNHVQRRLLQNLQTPENVLERIVRAKRLLEVYRLSIDRDLPERNRTRIRARLRPCFARAEAEDRAALIIKTEGRCLINLSGCTFDGRTTQILCNLSSLSPLFIQNLARFPATPALILRKLLRSPPVQRQAQLRALLMKHPNCGSELKQKG